MVRILWTTGVRITELLSLTARDIEDGVLNIRHLKSKDGKHRQIPLRSDVAKELGRYIESEGMKLGDRVFSLTRQRVNDIIREVAERAGFGGKVLVHLDSNRKHYISPHKFRDAIAVHWLKTKGDAEGQKALQNMLGHADFNTTAKYFKLSLDDVKNVYDKLWN